METLQELMKKVLADNFAFYLKAHNYHWNVEGPNFPQFHDFFGDLYQELHGSIDHIAEQIRALDSYAPGSMTRLIELAEVQDQTIIPSSIAMSAELIRDNEIILQDLNVVFELAEQLNKQGLADFIAGRIDVHNKHAWMLRSITK
jgi:starvation-inducible DNA-binding protein